jgi:hypothetical protein
MEDLICVEPAAGIEAATVPLRMIPEISVAKKK